MGCLYMPCRNPGIAVFCTYGLPYESAGGAGQDYGALYNSCIHVMPRILIHTI